MSTDTRRRLDVLDHLASHPLVMAASQISAELLAPNAAGVDQEGVPRSHLDALVAAGLLGLAGPAEAGGADAPPAVVRQVTELVAGADGATWFVLTQHATPLRAVERSPNTELRGRWLRALCTGSALAGVAVAHLRRDEGGVQARPSGDGWILDGTAAWVTSWGLADVVLLGATTATGDAVLALIPAKAQAGLDPSAPLVLAAMGATHTVKLTLDGLVVGPEDVVDVVPIGQWRLADHRKAANVTPAVFGLLNTIVAELGTTAGARGDAGSAALASDLDAEGAQVRESAYRLLDEAPEAESIGERLALRAHALELTVRAATALVVASGGAGMAMSASAQRLAREALFHLVQAQTPAVRRATLARLRDVG